MPRPERSDIPPVYPIAKPDEDARRLYHHDWSPPLSPDAEGEIARGLAAIAEQKAGVRDEWQRARETLREEIEVQCAIDALTGPFIGRDGKIEVAFTEHPEFERHYETLRSAWEHLPEDHPKRKTFEIIRVAYDWREDMRREAQTTCGEDIDCIWDNHLYTLPIVWVRDGEQDIFKVGYKHDARRDNSYARAHHDRFVAIGEQASMIMLEPHSNKSIGGSLLALWNVAGTGRDVWYGLLARDIAKRNPDIRIAEIDPRDESRGTFDKSDSTFIWIPMNNVAYPRYDPQFGLAFVRYLMDIDPAIYQRDVDRYKIFRILKDMSFRSLVFFENFVALRDFWIKWTHTRFFDDENALRDLPTGREYGSYTRLFSDAICALKLRWLARNRERLGIPEGPIVEFQGAAHIYAQTLFFQNPREAMRLLARNPHFIRAREFLPESDEWKQYTHEQADMEALIPAFDPEGIDELFDWKRYTALDRDPFEIWIARTDGQGKLTLRGYDFSGAEIVDGR